MPSLPKAVAAAGGIFTFTDNNCALGIANGKSCTFAVAFTPAAKGAVTSGASITVVAPSYTLPGGMLALTGTGIDPLSIAPASLAFGSNTVGVTTAAKTVTLTNVSAAASPATLYPALPLTVAAAGGSFTITDLSCWPGVANGKACTFTVTFKPSAKVAVSATLNIAVGDWIETVNLTGSGK